MSISGNLSTMALADLLEWANERSKTGALVIDGGAVEKRLFFEDGGVVASASTDPKEFLSSLLVAYSLIEVEEVEEIMARLEGAEGLLGRYLVNHEKISAEELADALLLKTKESVFDLFGWNEGEFRFVDGDALEGELTEFALDVKDLIREGELRQSRWSDLRQFVPSDRAIPVAVGFLDDTALPADERQILKWVDDQRSISEIAVATRNSEFRVTEVLVAALQRGRLKIVMPREVEVSAEPSPAGLSTGITMLDSDGLLRAAQRHFEEGSYEKTLRYVRAAQSLEPDNKELEAQIAQLERNIEVLLDDAGVTPESVPQLNRDIEELSTLDVTPEAGFLLTRIDGAYDLKSILRMTPIKPLEARLLIYRLVEASHVRLEPAR